MSGEARGVSGEMRSSNVRAVAVVWNRQRLLLLYRPGDEARAKWVALRWHLDLAIRIPLSTAVAVQRTIDHLALPP